ncbi:MAG: DUF1501 domain-containing protein [Vicinamibacterales bacterium]|nr:DUF1501 domain-containing protein [Vicinamibacterales bacterium]
MQVSRRVFIRNGATALAVGVTAPTFLSELAWAQGASSRSLVVVYLGGGNDALSTVVPYTDAAYYTRRPTLAVPAGEVLQIGSDSSGKALGLHPSLGGLKDIYNSGRLAIIQRTGYPDSSRSHFEGFDIWGTANPMHTQGSGWLGRYLDGLPQPVNPLVAWNTTSNTPRPLMAAQVGVPSITSPSSYIFSSPNGATEAAAERRAAERWSGYPSDGRPHVAFVHSTARAALGTLDEVAKVASYEGSVGYPTSPFGQALKAVGGAMQRGVGTKVFWVSTGGYDTHASQNPNTGTYRTLMATLNDGLAAFYQDLQNQGLLNSTLVIVYSEFGRRISENGSQGTDHGAAGVMMAMGGGVRGGLYGRAADLRQDASNPDVENNAVDVRHETDFRSVYARVIDNWLGTSSVAILGGDYRSGAPSFL